MLKEEHKLTNEKILEIVRDAETMKKMVAEFGSLERVLETARMVKALNESVKAVPFFPIDPAMEHVRTISDMVDRALKQ